jgi:hypothetical protein
MRVAERLEESPRLRDVGDREVDVNLWAHGLLL